MVVDLSTFYPSLKNNTKWDKQTVVIVASDWSQVRFIRSQIAKQRSPQSRHFIITGAIESDSFVNLNYDPVRNRRPQDRNVRIVYVDGSRVSANEVYERFSDAYIITVNAPDGWNEGGDKIDTNEHQEENGYIASGYTAEIKSIPD